MLRGLVPLLLFGDMPFVIDAALCVGCGACKTSCPTGSIRMVPGWKAVIDTESCVDCGMCSEICHRHAPLKHGRCERTCRR